MMKYLSICLVVGTAIFLCGFGYPPSPLMEEVDQAWKEGRATEIPALIEKRLGEAPRDTTALFLGHSYHLLWDFDSQKASTYQKKLEEIIFPIRDSITDADEKRQFVEWLATSLPPLPSSEPALSEAQKQEMRKSMRELFKDQFPGTLLAQTNTKVLSQYLKEASTALGSDYENFQKRKVAQIKNIGAAVLIKDLIGLGTGEQNEIPKEKWPVSLRNLEPVRAFVSSENITLWFYRMASTYDGVIIHRESEFKGDSPYTTYTNFGDGVVWFHSSQ
jgi:hypothetical protein